MGNAESFWWGVAGNLALEVVLFCGRLRRTRTGRIPRLYTSRAFLLGHVLLALVAGLMAIAWQIRDPIHGLMLGAAAPRLVLWLAMPHLNIQ